MQFTHIADYRKVGPPFAIHDMGPRLRDTLVDLMLNCPHSPATPEDLEHARQALQIATGGDLGRAEAALLFFEHAMRRPAHPTLDDYPDDHVDETSEAAD